MKFIVIVAARLGSKRLPGKALLNLMGYPVIVFILKRLSTSKIAEKIIFATTELAEDDPLAEMVGKYGFEVFRGSNEDVLHRYAEAAKKYDTEYVVRVTGDCPFVSGETLDWVLSKSQSAGDFDLLTTKPHFPSGIDYEICKKECLLQLDAMSLKPDEREHMFNRMYHHPAEYKIIRLNPPPEIAQIQAPLLLDTLQDYVSLTQWVTGLNDIHIPIQHLNFQLNAN